MPVATNPDGSVSWTGNVTFVSGVPGDLTTYGVATLTLTPAGGVSNLAPLLAGTPGVPPVLRNVIVQQVPYGTTPGPASWTQVAPGGAGVASTYDLTLPVQMGQQGPAGTMTVGLATDVSGTPVDGNTLVFNGGTGKYIPSAPKRPLGPWVLPSIAAFSGNSASTILGSITVPAQPWAWRPMCFAQFAASGTANTHVDGKIMLNDPASGAQVAFGRGYIGSDLGIPAALYPITVIPNWGDIATTPTLGQVAANASATFYLIAFQTQSTTDTWRTNQAPGYMHVMAQPI